MSHASFGKYGKPHGIAPAALAYGLLYHVFGEIATRYFQTVGAGFLCRITIREHGIPCDRIAVSGNRAAAGGKTVPFSVFSPKTGREILQS